MDAGRCRGTSAGCGGGSAGQVLVLLGAAGRDIRRFDEDVWTASPLDRIWGIGLAADDPRAGDPAAWRGLNLLGFALMQARSELAR
ncbi:NADAR domain-containing protein [Kribbella capetownensis]|uniref:NADAR domain-containing protein n=1 Tax=Kribbella capetownensis TaxID=1572659 RepID=UPI001EE03433|nr:NADAR domain-containing protein [Kribbella capetownensis]